MCGIAGVLTTSPSSSSGYHTAVGCMKNALLHRGPDGNGEWSSHSTASMLAHTRLAIIGLSTAGSQPMLGESGRFALVFNGEIYNFRELRAALEREGDTFSTETDTEVLLAGLIRYGQAFIPKLRGMFAFCFWDEKRQTALLARDPFGIKPLYYSSLKEGGLAFASELRALLASGLVERKLNPPAVAAYFATGSMRGPETLISGVSELPAGHWATFSSYKLDLHAYWSPKFQPNVVPHEKPALKAREALMEAVTAHLVADVPVGIFLSGGLDSTAILALANKVSATPLATFSIGVDDERLNEAKTAANTAQALHSEFYQTTLDARSTSKAFPDYLAAMDTPSIDGFNTFMVSRHTRTQGIKVALSGLGGDELLAGYRSFDMVPKLVKWGRFLHRAGPVAGWLGRLLERRAKTSRMQRLGHFLTQPPTLANAYASTRGVFSLSAASKLASYFCRTPAVCPATTEPKATDPRDAVSELELTCYMRTQLLRDSDAMSMAHGLELRVPFVDSFLFDDLATLPATVRLRQGKSLLLDAVPEIPQEVSKAAKRGFVFPFSQWLETEFGEQFSAACQDLPVVANEWYQKWAVFVFKHWCQKLGIS